MMVSHEDKERAVIPLESNPEVFTDFAKNLGLDPLFAFHDIYSLTDADLLAFLPRPVKAIILLFPISDKQEKQDDVIKNDTQSVMSLSSKDAVWFKQTIKNACGLYAILHSLANNKSMLTSDSILGQFINDNYETKNENNGNKNELTDDFIFDICNKFLKIFEAGETKAPDAHSDVDLHFITFVSNDKNQIFELDGRNPKGPSYLGDITASKNNADDTDLIGEKAIIDRVQWYMDNVEEGNSLNFSLLGLSKSWD
ncbi:ubiquitin-specific protease YUH1 NDAI_0D00480 [Naumovozyma dairenensis CBS 421]|uniref:Ubiquitin carboxyl-terminal hydrolase n=1 Tax=Naumovozyma dairenensis (strain ATCC 10597 / BCRC 20456 / CBS 421 / NBRC 0211 / NRRL Y-12639) TaxID=1071378 RepID=G0W9A1_NAUDC|nr:hypothetical protein NDAI_0D00480 [Naumovozyma dairenensis CBS 421]CCD24362.1 hypothetical protein NDAI_0D00480 [Naumovozyma dairenensis CBS 421]